MRNEKTTTLIEFRDACTRFLQTYDPNMLKNPGIQQFVEKMGVLIDATLRTAGPVSVMIIAQRIEKYLTEVAIPSLNAQEEEMIEKELMTTVFTGEIGQC